MNIKIHNEPVTNWLLWPGEPSLKIIVTGELYYYDHSGQKVTVTKLRSEDTVPEAQIRNISGKLQVKMNDDLFDHWKQHVSLFNLWAIRP